MQCSTRIWQRIVQFGRHVEHHHVPAFDVQALDVRPKSDEQQYVPGMKSFAEKATSKCNSTTTEAYHCQALFCADSGFQDGLIDQLRVGRNHRLNHANLMSCVGEISAIVAKRQSIEPKSIAQPRHLDIRRERVDKDHVVALKLCLGNGADHLGPECEFADDGHNVHAGRSQRQLLETPSQYR